MSRRGREDGGLASGFGWFVLGMVAGATIAVLLTPKSGRDTRQLLSDTTHKSKAAVAGTTRDLIDRGRDIYDRSVQIYDDAVELFEQGRKLVRG